VAADGGRRQAKALAQRRCRGRTELEQRADDPVSGPPIDAGLGFHNTIVT